MTRMDENRNPFPSQRRKNMKPVLYIVVPCYNEQEVLSEEDFYERCACAARKKSPVPPTDIQEKRKLTDFLMRYGYGGDQIRYALQHAWQME